MARPVSSYDKAVAVTKSDTTELNCVGFYVGGGGNIAITPFGGGAAVTLTAIIPGTVYPIACQKIMETNTTATAIVALY